MDTLHRAFLDQAEVCKEANAEVGTAFAEFHLAALCGGVSSAQGRECDRRLLVIEAREEVGLSATCTVLDACKGRFARGVGENIYPLEL